MIGRAGNVALAAMLLAIPVRAQGAALPAADAAGASSHAKVTPPMKVRVIDGRTFSDLQTGEVFRLFAVDVCSLDQIAMLDGQPWSCGVVSAAWLTQVTLGQWVLCNRVKAVPDATLARCATARQPDIAASMIAQGLAVTTHDPELPTPADYNRLDAAARRTFQGIWHSQFDMPWDYRSKHGTRP